MIGSAAATAGITNATAATTTAVVRIAGGVAPGIAEFEASLRLRQRRRCGVARGHAARDAVGVRGLGPVGPVRLDPRDPRDAILARSEHDDLVRPAAEIVAEDHEAVVAGADLDVAGRPPVGG